LDSTYESDTQIQHTDSQAKFLISAKPKIVKTKNQKVLYNFLAQNTKLITTYDDLSEYLEISNGTIRDILRKFERNGLISKEKYVSKDGVQGLHITLQQTVPTGNSNRPIRLLDSTVDSPSKIDRSSICLSKEGGSLREGVKQEQSIDPTDIDWSPEERLKNLTDNDIAFFWPNLHKSGFGTHQIQQILERLAKVGKQPDKVMRGLDHAEWELENGTMADKEGRAVKDPCSYVFNSLAKHGYYRRPAGYVSPEEQAEIDEKEEAEKREKLAKEKAKRLEQAAKEEKHAKFLEWKSSLSEEELSKILENKIGPTEPWLRQYWENNILASGS
jgi:predicted ArsR family transcriptional regulator